MRRFFRKACRPLEIIEVILATPSVRTGDGTVVRWDETIFTTTREDAWEVIEAWEGGETSATYYDVIASRRKEAMVRAKVSLERVTSISQRVVEVID